MLYEAVPDPERYRQHVEEYALEVDCAAFRHGKVFGSPFGEPQFAYYAEFEWGDRESFKAAANSAEFAASGADGMAMGIPFTVHFVGIE
jgi:hypothetical protein